MNISTKILLFTILLSLFSCSSNQSSNNDEKPNIVATTGMLKDAIINLVGDEATVTALMGPGVDPHLYQASPGDLAKMNKADVIVFNGLYLEGKLNDILDKLSANKKVVNFSNAINKRDLLPVIDAQYEDEIYDPHIWFSIDVWSQGISGLATKLGEYYPDLKETIQKNKANYLTSLSSLKDELKKKIETIPEEQRVMVTSHDAFQYFGNMLNIKVEALQGISTATDFGLQDRKQLVDLIIKEDISAIFIESSVGEKPIKAILSDCHDRDHDVQLGGTLFSDAMGKEGSAAGTYIGMLQHNVNTVVDGLKNEQ